MRDPDRMVAEAQRLGPHVGRFMTQLLAGPLPWAHLRQAQRLLRLANKYGRPRLEVAGRTIDEWIPLFDDPILAQSAIDRLAHNAYQVVMEGDSYRKRQRPGEDRARGPLPRRTLRRRPRRRIA